MANQIKRRNVSSLTYENFPGGHPSQYCSHPCTLNSTGIYLAGVNRCERLCGQPSIGTVHPNPISIDCRRFMSPFGARLVALSSSSLEHSIDTSLETGVAEIEEREAVAVFVCLREG
ncbi:bifunctional monodehydroascorbate reductase and carbonic anhydrase nectarin-3-like [Dorcoceras hygrometricum]|uniref:Bifunctional monodehydroascorbate reductase and carbonic anhydrase nectarin-3-like n=1 Tax=Dorcoceras hygrometricum TaxID=472368 RepID=A0A2Z7BPF0_9LAMI|nr:bifunctional monodehydroascorbate reductase and carbonic anhydrase nectarin-3-like [Dorcoceras hygrometricum]